MLLLKDTPALINEDSNSNSATKAMEWGDYYMNEEDYAMQVGMGAGFRVRSFFLFSLFFLHFVGLMEGNGLRYVLILCRRTVQSPRVTPTLSTREGETRRRRGKQRARIPRTTQNLEAPRRRRRRETHPLKTVSIL